MNTSAYTADELLNLDALAALRKRFEGALVTGAAEDLAPLLTPDFVYYQPCYEGPCTFGRQAHVDYAASLPKIHRAQITVIDFFLMGRWAFETGEEVYEEDDGRGGSVEQVARFGRLSYCDEAGVWRMARTARATARDLRCFRLPPKAGFVTNAGRGHWLPMPVDREAVNDTRDLLAQDREGLRLMMRDADPTTMNILQSVNRGPDYVCVSAFGNYTWREFENFQRNTNQPEYQYDEIYKFYEDARVVVPGQWGFTMGKGTGAHVSRTTGVRRSGVQFYLYVWKRVDAGKDPWPWKVYASFSGDLYLPIVAYAPDYPGKSNVIHRALQQRWEQRPAETRNNLRDLVDMLESKS